jgi:lipoprotein-releasing system permease protein
VNLPLFIAKRYLLSKKSNNAINIISWISVGGITVGAMALIVVLSVFNGFENLVISLYNTFDSDIRITAVEGKTFDPAKLPLKEFKTIPGFVYQTEVLEENVLLKYGDKQFIGAFKAVNDDYLKHSRLDTMLVEGEYTLEQGTRAYALIGQGVAYYLSVNLNDFSTPISLYVPKKKARFNMLNPEDAFSRESVFPSGVFSVQQEIDSKYILIPLPFARGLLDNDKNVNAIELGFEKDQRANAESEIRRLAGPGFVVKNRYEQHEMLYKIMRSEKWAIFLILSFILIIATFNVIGSLTMLIVEKKKDISILFSMGAEVKTIRRIFMTEGLLITATGALTGLFFGLIICFIQYKFGIVKLEGQGSFVIDSYPVMMKPLDFFLVFVTVMVIGFIAAWLPSRQLKKFEPVNVSDERAS